MSRLFFAPLFKHKLEFMSGAQFMDFLFGEGYGREVNTYKTVEGLILQGKEKVGNRYLDGLKPRIVPIGSFIVARWDTLINPGHVEVETWKLNSKSHIYMVTQDVWTFYIQEKVERVGE